MKRVAHDHEPVYRVVRAGWPDPLDASFSREAPDNRWNTSAFSALYCCCSETVARAIVRDLLRYAAVEVEELQGEIRPQLVEIGWSGQVVDAISEDGLRAAGLPSEYPRGVTKETTRGVAAAWHGVGAQGVVSRSASLARLGAENWRGDHRRFGELAIFVDNAALPRLVRRRRDLTWLAPEDPH